MSRSQPPPPKTYNWKSLPALPDYSSDTSPRKRFHLWWWLWFRAGALVAVLVVALLALSFLAGRFTAPSLHSTPSPSRVVTRTLTTLQTFSGSGPKQTDAFTVQSAWQISWLCAPRADPKNQYQLKIDVNNADTTFFAFTTGDLSCQKDSIAGSIKETQTGHFYLYITSKGPWAIEIQTFQQVPA